MADKATRSEVIAALESEETYARKKWADGNPQDQHSQAAWILYMQHHLAKAAALASSTSSRDPVAVRAVQDEIRKVTNLGMRAMCNHGAPIREMPECPGGAGCG